MAVEDKKIADFTVKSYAFLKLNHPESEIRSVPDPTFLDCFPGSEFFVHKALLFFANSTSAGLDGTWHQILKHLTAKSTGQTRLIFFIALTNLLIVIFERKGPFDIRPYFFSEKIVALKTRWRTSSYCCGQ